MNQRIKKKKLTIQILQTAKSLEGKGIIFCTYPYGKVTNKELYSILKYLKNCVAQSQKVLLLPNYITVSGCTMEDLIQMKKVIEELIAYKDK